VVTWFVIFFAPWLQVFGFGPDETAYFRLILFKVSVLDAVVSAALLRSDKARLATLCPAV